MTTDPLTNQPETPAEKAPLRHDRDLRRDIPTFDDLDGETKVLLRTIRDFAETGRELVTSEIIWAAKQRPDWPSSAESQA